MDQTVGKPVNIGEANCTNWNALQWRLGELCQWERWVNSAGLKEEAILYKCKIADAWKSRRESKIIKKDKIEMGAVCDGVMVLIDSRYLPGPRLYR